MDEPDDLAGDMPNLPATMADIFFALVSVVILMLLSLTPAIRTPGALVAPPPFDISRSNVLIDGRPPVMLVAEAGGLRIMTPAERLIPLDAILDDADLAKALRGASAEPGVLLVVRPEGQEATFLFDALASTLALGAVYHLRLDGDCGYVVAADLARSCAAASRKEAGR